MNEFTAALLAVIAGSTGAAVIKLIDNVVQWHLKRKDAKDAKAEEETTEAQQVRTDAHEELLAHERWAKDQLEKVCDCVAILAIEQLTWTCKHVIHDKEITLGDRQRIHAMYAKAHAIGVNGDLKDLLSLINELPLIDPMQDNDVAVTERRELI